ncbi:hypothetical protein FHR70_003748 [Microvirga lupini]|uniref:Uncharacterized protein n=1 Tax=Microvirga lupini TaxID=420324 RepID=A0A7W4YXK1_9HYPH|nr:hypothetical protein [Microvirga lupini]MBB3020662.1 hypothetical protein [Microvirga lupini]
MDEDAWDEKILEELDRAFENAGKISGKGLGPLVGAMLAACVKTVRDEMREKHRKTDERLTAIEEHLTAIREGRE